MGQAKRFDRARLDKAELTPQGFLRVPAYFTRTGVFTYRKADGSVIRELRHPDDVFHPDSLASLQMAPVTDDHPPEFVTPENVKNYSVGWISENIQKDDSLVAGSAIVAEKNAIARVDRGKVELSCGYLADLVEEKGVFDGEPYDCRQKNIRYNHVAIVDRGRAGPLVRLRLDSEDAILDEDGNGNEKKETPEMKKIKIDGKEVEVSQEVFDAIMAERKAHQDALDAEKKARQDAEEKMKDKKKEGEDEDEDEEKKKLKEDADRLQARVDALEEKLKERKDMGSEMISSAVRERIAIEKTASAVLGSDTKLDGKSNLEVMKEVVAKASPKTDLADKSEVYVRARFDAITEELDGREERRFQLGRKITDSRKEDEFDSEAARKKAHADSRDLWKQPLAASKE